jgi:hypothetical protein
MENIQTIHVLNVHLTNKSNNAFVKRLDCQSFKISNDKLYLSVKEVDFLLQINKCN